MGSRMLRIIGATKWPIHPEGGKTKIVKPRGGVSSYPPPILPNGGGVGLTGKTGGKEAISLIHSKKIFYHTGGGTRPPSPVTVLNGMSRILVYI